MNPRVSYGSSIVDGFWVGSDSVFACDFLVNWDSVPKQIHESAMEVVSVIISESLATQFLVMIPS